MTQAVALFKSAPVSENLAKLMVLKATDTGTCKVRLLPATSKTGESLKSVSGLAGQALKAYRRRHQKELLTAMAREHAAVTSSGLYGGHEMKVTSSGVVSFAYKPLAEVDTKDVTAKLSAKDKQIAELEAQLKALTAKASA